MRLSQSLTARTEVHLGGSPLARRWQDLVDGWTDDHYLRQLGLGKRQPS
jgi:hypothetical protein